MESHIVTTMWGYGKAGLGPFRTQRHLDTPDAGEKLQAVAQTVNDKGAVIAFDDFIPKNAPLRLGHLGSAFATKDLFFMSNNPRRHRALILDSIIIGWLADHTTLTFPVGTDSAEHYGQYLYAMYAWAADLGERPEDIELVMFGQDPGPGWRPC